MIVLYFTTIFFGQSFQFDLLLKLFEDDEKATISTTKRGSAVGRAGQRENKKTVGLQVRE